jgi:hypothetical protein
MQLGREQYNVKIRLRAVLKTAAGKIISEQGMVAN